MENENKRAMKNRIKNLMKAVVFTVIGGILLYNAGQVLGRVDGTYMCKTGSQYVQKHKNDYDVLFLGTSVAATNVSNQELFERYGIAGVSIGGPVQPIYQTYYLLKDALRFQDPKVVFYVPNSLFQTEEYIKYHMGLSADTFIHYTADSIASPGIKYEMLKTTKTYLPDIDMKEYFSKIYHNHGKWESVTPDLLLGKVEEDYINGNMALYTTAEGYAGPEEITDYSVYQPADIEEDNMEFLDKMIRLCEENNTDFVLVNMCAYFTPEEIRRLELLSEEYQVPFLNISEKEIGFSRSYDMNDGVHYNLSGAIKVTGYIGDWLTDHYQLTDHRGQKEYDFLQRQSEVFGQQKDAMEMKVSLLQSVSLSEYLYRLSRADLKDFAVLVSVCGEVNGFGEQIRSSMEDLGLEQLAGLQPGDNYCALICGQQVQEMAQKEECQIQDNVNGHSYLVKSGGTEDQDQCSAKIDGKEFLQKGNGINFVIYHIPTGVLASSVYFDMGTQENPPQSRIVQENAESRQAETDANIWQEFL